MDYKISDSEWKVMEILWKKGAATQSEVMDALAPTGPVYQAGTLSGNPLAVTAGIETLKQMR